MIIPAGFISQRNDYCEDMIHHIDHIGLVARSLEEASELFLETLGFSWDLERTPMPDGVYMPQENAKIYFIQVGGGETQIELLLPQDRVTGMGKWLDKRGPSVHHVAYMVDDLESHAAELVDKGLERIDLGPDAAAAFFYPRSTMGILTELVDARTVARLHANANAPSVLPPDAVHEARADFERSRRLAEDWEAHGADTLEHDHPDDLHDHGSGLHRDDGSAPHSHPHVHTHGRPPSG